MNLTSKQEAFCQAIADGVSQAEAYRRAYNVSETTKPETVWKRSSELMQNGAVTGRVHEIQESLAKKALWTREMSVKALIESYRVAKDRKNSNGMTGAVKELNAMHGYNEPQQIDLNIRQLPASVDDFV
jgi:hypothetical protein